MKGLYSVLLLFFLAAASANAQDIPAYGLSKVHINDGNERIIAEVRADQNGPKAKADRFYFWYAANAIHATQGGYSGRLLNGSYSASYPDGSLKLQGTYQNGLKTGLWKAWSEDGALTDIVNWSEGIKQGAYSRYNSAGKVIEQGNYDGGLLSGKVVYLSNDSVKAAYYRKGKQIGTPKTLWQRVNIFKKHQ